MSRHVSELLSAYIDGALGVRDVERVRVHLDGCAACVREYEALQRVQRLLRTLPDPAPRPGFGDRLHWRLQRESSARRPASLVDRLAAAVPLRRARPVRLAIAASALAVLLAVPWARMTGPLTIRQAPIDTDVYVRHYLLLSSDRSLVDEATTTFVSADLGVSDQPTR